MKQVRTFYCSNHSTLQELINDFIEDLGPLGIVHDIHYNVVNAMKIGELFHFAMVIYSFEEITA